MRKLSMQSSLLKKAEATLLAKLNDAKSTPSLPRWDTYLLIQIKHHLLEGVLKCLPKSDCVVSDIKLDLPPSSIDADLTMDVFHLGKRLKTNPIALCAQLVDMISLESTGFIQSATALKGYLNLTLSADQILPRLIAQIEDLGAQYGCSDLHHPKIVVVDYSGPNIAKPIGVGHLRSTIIGQSLAHLYEATGYTALKINHIGDWGTQFGALIYAYDHWCDDAAFDAHPIRALKELYVTFHQKKTDDPTLMDKARAHFTQLEAKNAHEVDLWTRFRALSIESFEQIYRQFDIKFDAYQGESGFADQTAATMKAVLAHPVTKQEPGSKLVVVDDLEGLPSFLLIKEDGSSLYLTRDLTALMYRHKTFQPDTVLYVVGNEQHLHFKQLFALHRAIEPNGPAHLHHIGFGLILTDGKKMSTRSGSLVELDELVSQATQKVAGILEEKQTELPPEDIHALAIGAIIYNDLSRTRTKDIHFDWEKMLSMDSGSSIYLQYTYARIASILRKFKDRYDSLSDQPPTTGIEVSDHQLALPLMIFPKVIEDARAANLPNVIANYLDDLAQSFNTYYGKYSIKDSADAPFVVRYRLLGCINEVLKTGLGLLNIRTLERM